MRKFAPYFLVLATVILWSCSGKTDDQFEVVGKIEGMPKNVLVFLEEIGLNNELKIIDSTRSKDNGTFVRNQIVQSTNGQQAHTYSKRWC
jgi:hypothetical protein